MADSCCSVSVVVPIYNVERCLRQCLESLVHQTQPVGLEIILVNDGSTDGSPAIALEYAARYPNVVCIDKPNGGCASARNAGLHAARSEYVGFVDGDDWVDVTMFEKLCRKAAAEHVDVVQCGLTKYYECENRRVPVDEDWIEDLVRRVGGRLDAARELICVQPTIWRRIYRRSLLEENHIAFPEDVRMFDDLPFQAMTLGCARSIAVVNEPLYYYRLQREGQDVGVKDQRLFVHFRLFEIIEQFVVRSRRYDLLPHLFAMQLNTHRWGLSQIGEPWKEEYFGRVCDELSRGLWSACLRPTADVQCFLARNYAWFRSLERGRLPIGLRARCLLKRVLRRAA